MRDAPECLHPRARNGTCCPKWRDSPYVVVPGVKSDYVFPRPRFITADLLPFDVGFRHSISMDRRTDHRFNFDQPVSVTLLERDTPPHSGRFVDISQHGMRIVLNSHIDVGEVVKLEIGDHLMVGEVRHCEPQEHEFAAGLSILTWVERSELARLMEEIGAGGSAYQSRGKLMVVATPDEAEAEISSLEISPA